MGVYLSKRPQFVYGQNSLRADDSMTEKPTPLDLIFALSDALAEADPLPLTIAIPVGLVPAFEARFGKHKRVRSAAEGDGDATLG